MNTEPTTFLPSPDEPRFTEIDGVRIRYREHRRAGAPWLLLTNAWPQSIRCWDLHWATLSERFSLLAVDLPGFGLSQPTPEPLTPSRSAAFLVRVLDRFGVPEAHGIGPDVGVPAMLWLARRAPDRVRSIVVFDGPGFYPPVVAWSVAAVIRSGAVRRGLAGLGLLFAHEAMRRGYRRHVPSAAALAEYRIVNGRAGSFARTLEYLASYPEDLTALGRELGAITRPVLVLWGERDVFLSPANAPELAARLPRASLHVLGGAGHFAHEDAGDEFARRVVAWCDGGHAEVGAASVRPRKS